jgi:putative ABC transport system permease protein
VTAVIVKALRDLRRRRLQAAVIFVTTLLAVATGTMALTLLSQTSDPFQVAFDAQRGAHLRVAFDGRTDPGTLASTPSRIGATAFGGPYRATPIQFQYGGHKYAAAAVGRDEPGGEVEQLRLVAGRWPVGDSEIAVTRSFADLSHVSVGDTLKVVSVADAPVLTVAGEVIDIDQVRADVSAQRAWVRTSAIDRLTAKGGGYYLMNYRFASDPTSAQLSTAVDTLRAALPPGSITSSINYLLVRSIFNVVNQLLIGILVAFSIFALAATAAIVANLVTGIVISAYREIGIMKAIGFTPLQVVTVFLLQILLPTAAACLVGIPAGTVLTQPLLASSSDALGLPYQAAFSPALDLLALAGALLIVTIAALVPAFRAGRLKPAVVIANAAAPRGQSGRWVRRLASRLGLPRSAVLGVGDAAARPVRAILTVAAVFLGVATVVIALGQTRSFAGIYPYEAHVGAVDVVVSKSAVLTDADAMRLFESQPETARVVAQTTTNITVPGIADPVPSFMFRGDSAALGYLVVRGRWFNGPGEVVAPRGLLQDARLEIGDTFTATFRGTSVPLRLVGVVYDFAGGPGGHELMLDSSTIVPVIADQSPSTYFVTLKPGANVEAYVQRVGAAQPDQLEVQVNTANPSMLATVNGVLFAIAAVIALMAVAGIFNTLLLNAREGVRDTATLKALGMSPRQLIAMVATSAGFLAVVGGALAVPAGVQLYRVLFDVVSAFGGNETPPAAYSAYAPWELIAIPLAGVALAMLAALLPARWAARTNVVEVLRAE